MISTLFTVKKVYEGDEDALFFWREKIFNRLFLTLLFIAVIPYAFSYQIAVETSKWQAVIFYSLIYLLGAFVTFFKTLPFQLRVWAGISGFYLMGMFSLVFSGATSSAGLYLLSFSAFAALFSGIKGGFAALVLNIVTLTISGFLHAAGFISPDALLPVPDTRDWFMFAGTFFLLCSAVTLSLAVLVKALAVSGRGFKHLVRNTSDIIWTLDQNFDITFINSAVHTTFGFFQEELIGKPVAHFLDEEKIEKFKDKMQKEDDFDYETIILHKNGTPIHVKVSGSKISHFLNRGTMYQGIIKNISQEKIQEQEQKHLKKKLAQAEKYSALGILAGSVAHDLNNILSGIATYPEVILMDSNLDPKIRQGLDMIRDSGQKASAVVSDLLTISRGSHSEKEIININSILDRYASAHDFDKIRQTYQQVEIEIQAEQELLNIKGSYIHIEKTIMNLFLNAVEEVSLKENGKVLIKTANCYIDSAMPGYKKIVPGEYVTLSVIDNGSGIDQKNLKKIFDPFFTKKEMGRSGTGLGLNVVWNAVRDHNGFINVISNDKGTTFDLLFPATREDIPRKAEESSIEEIRGQGEMILVVDDLKDQQKIATSILENLGYRAQAVDDGYAAVEFIKNNPTDLVVLDMLLGPSINGLKTFRMIREIKPGQKAIIASGYSESEEVLMAQELGAGSFVKKPYTILDMGIAVKEELEK